MEWGWSSLAMFIQVTDHLLGGDYNFNLRGGGGGLEMSQQVPDGHDYVPPMIGASSES